MASYRKKFIKSKINKSKPKKSIWKCKWFWISLLLLIIVILSSYFLVFSKIAQIEEIVISGNQKINSSEIKPFIEEKITKHFFTIGPWSLSTKSIFLINKKDIKNDLLSNFLIIDNIDISKDVLHQKISFNIQERESFGVYCDRYNNCFNIDHIGKAFESKDCSFGCDFIVRHSDKDSHVSAGDIILDKYQINSIYEISENLKNEFNILIQEASLNKYNRLNIKTSEGWYIYFDLKGDYNINSQLIKLGSLLRSDFSTETDRVSVIKYIDLRPEDRAILCDNNSCGF